DPALQKTFGNTMLAEAYAEPHDAPDWQRLRERASADPLGVVPAGVLFLSAGVDVQRDRIEVSVWGWGRGKRSWLCDHVVLEGDTASDVPWQGLSGLVFRRWGGPDGRPALGPPPAGVATPLPP